MTMVSYNLGFVAFNNPQDLNEMVLSLEKWKPSGLKSCLVVDHSTDDGLRSTNRSIASQAGWFYVTQPNLGFGSGVNMLASMALEEVLIVLNLDISIREMPPFYLMAEAIIRGGVSLVGTSLLNQYGRRVAGRLPALSPSLFFHDYHVDIDEHASVASSLDDIVICDGAVHGGCFAVKVEDFIRARGIDEALFLYAEEFDIFIKYVQSGHRIGFLVSNALVHASEGQSNPEKQFLNIYNLRYLARRERKWILSLLLTMQLCRDVLRLSQRIKIRPILFSNLPRPSLLHDLFHPNPLG